MDHPTETTVRSDPMSVSSFCVLLLALLTVPETSMAQAARLTGRVLDVQGAAVPGATIRVTRATGGLIQVVVSAADGRYDVPGLVPGSVLVQVDREGFRRLVLPLTISVDSPTTADLRLELSGVDEVIVVTAAGAPQALRETSKAVTVVDGDDIHARQEATIADIVRFVPGVQVRDNGGPGQLGSLRIRGLRSDAAGVLIDGLRFRDAASTQGDASAFFSNVHFVAADRVEVLRGSGSSLYGTNAVGGVVNVVSAVGGGPFGGEAQVEAGSFGQVRTRGSISGTALNNRLAFSGGAIGWNTADGFDGDDAARSTGGHGSVRFQANPATAVSVRFLGSSDRVDTNSSPSTNGVPAANIPDETIVEAIAVEPDQIERLNNGEAFEIGPATFFPARNDPDARRRSAFQTFAVRLERQQSSSLHWQASYQRVHTARTHLNGPMGPGFQTLTENVSEFSGDIDTVELKGTAQAASWLSLTAGYEFERERYFEHLDDNLPAPDRLITEARVSQRSHALFGAAQIGLLSRRLQISVSGRAQGFRLSPPTFSTAGTVSPYDGLDVGQPPRALTGDVSAAYFVSASATKVRAHVGNAYRAPALYERYGGGFFADPVQEVVVFSAFGDPRLAPDRYVLTDVGVDQYLWEDRLLVSATGFFVDVRSLTDFNFTGGIHPDTDPFGRFSGYLNGSGGTSTGVEVGFDAEPTPMWRVQGAYTYTDAKTEDDISVADFFKVPGVIPHTFAVVVRHRHGRLDAVADMYHGSSSYGPLFAAGGSRAYRFPGFTTVGLTASYRVSGASAMPLRVYVKADNLFDAEYYLGGWRGLGRTVATGVSVGF
jgi:iron complex outermembrane receptor protein